MPTVRSASLFLIVVAAVTARAYQPSSTSPYTFNGTYSCSSCETFDHYKVGDGNWHAPGCAQSGSPLYYCDCSKGYQSGELLQPPILRVNGSTIELEYFARNAYCNPPADGGNVNEPNAIPNFIQVYAINPQTFASTVVHVVPPYWEHGKISFTGSPGCTLYRAAYFVMDTFSNIYVVSSNVVGGTSSSSGMPCLADTNSCPIAGGSGGGPGYPADGVSPSFGHPINIGSANMQYTERLFSIGEPGASLDFSITYNSRDTTVGPLGRGFIHPFAQTLTSPTGGTRLWRNATGGRLLLAHETHPVSGGDIYRVVYPSDTVGAASFNGSTYTFRDLAGTQTVLQNTASGTYTPGTITDRWGNQFTTVYTGSNLTQITDPLGRSWTLAYSGSRLTSVTDGDGNQWRFSYDSTTNQLMAVFDPLHTGSTPWRQFTWVTYASGQPAVLAAVADDSGAVLEGHQYDSSGRATSSWTGDTTGGSLPAPGTNARELATITYTDDTHRTVTSGVETGVSQSTVYTITAGSGRFLATSIDGTCVSCGSAVEAQTFTYDDYNRPLTRVAGIDRSGSGGTDERVTSAYTYDANGQVLTATEAVGTAAERTTSYAYTYAPWPSFVTSVTRASVAKSGQQSVTTYAWNTTGATESALTVTRSGWLAESDSTATQYTTVTHFDTRHRVTEIDGPLTDQKLTRAYYSDTDTTLDRRGRLSEARTYTGTSTYLATTFDNYDIYGNAKTLTDPNGVQTTLTTDGRGRVLTSTSVHPSGDTNEPGDYVMTSTYDTRDRLVSITLPRGNSMRYQYEDGSNALTATVRVDDASLEHERLLLTLNLLGSKASEAMQECTSPANPCTSWVTRRSDSFHYDAAARLARITHADSTTSDYAYDSRGNLVGTKDERHTAANTLNAYDARNRLVSVTQKQTIVSGSDIVTAYAYDANGNLTLVTDPNGNETSYLYDDFARLQQQTSPVTGVTTYTYDGAGNLTSTTDANGATTDRQYDAMNRVTSSESSGGLSLEDVTWTYDDPTSGAYGKGRVASMSDPTGTTTYAYERRGLLRSEEKALDAVTFAAAYEYDGNGNRTGMTYPSGREVTYTFDHADRPYSAASTGRVYVESALYAPFGPLTELAYGNDTVRTIQYDSRYLVEENALSAPGGTIADYVYSSDAAGNVTEIDDATDSAYDRTFGYDDLNRLTSANSGSALWGSGSYEYDAMGNILSLQLGTARDLSFEYDGTTPRIVSVTGTSAMSPEYDAAGNEVTAGRQYGARNNMTRIVGGSLLHPAYADYGYDGRGVRITEMSTATWPQYRQFVRYRFYSPELHLLSLTNWLQSDASVAIDSDIIWFGAEPVAQDFPAATAPTYTFTDHLGTPLLQTDASANVVWRAEYEPYGQVFTYRTGDANSLQVLRLPGQEYDGVRDDAGEEHYNIFRWYRAGWGRYTQADPIGLRAGVDLYAYVSSDPIGSVDPLGLWALDKSCKGFGPAITQAMTKAVNALSHCLKCGERDKAISALMNATIKCDMTSSGCGSNPWGSAIVLKQQALSGHAGCPCLEALLGHEAAHDLQPWWDNSEGVPEVIENKCFSCGTNDNHLPPPSISGVPPRQTGVPPTWIDRHR